MSKGMIHWCPFAHCLLTAQLCSFESSQMEMEIQFLSGFGGSSFVTLQFTSGAPNDF